MAEEDGAAGAGGIEDLRAQLEAARAEVERLQCDAADDGRRVEAAVIEAARLRDELAAASAAGEAAAAEAASLREALDAAAGRSLDAAARYRELLVRSEPELPPELISGDSIDAVEASAAAARALAEQMRAHMASQAHAARVPAGAPARAAPDLSALTAEQKIRYGLAQRRDGQQG